MKLPAGTDGGSIANPQDGNFFLKLAAFTGAAEIRTAAGSGFIVIEKGRQLAAFFRAGTSSYSGGSALPFLVPGTRNDVSIRIVRLRVYDTGEMARALAICRESGLLIIPEEAPRPAAPAPAAKPGEPAKETAGVLPAYLDPAMLKKLLSQPGVIAVSAFFEGFPVQSLGDADFEHVAASAEDFMRAGVRIAEDMNAGPLEQLILETARNKFIIAPCGDLFLCVFTGADAQLGLIRVVLRSIQSEIRH